MPKSKKSKSKKIVQTKISPQVSKSNKKMIIGAAIFLALVGYFLYKSMLTTPDINRIAPEECGRGQQWDGKNGKCVAKSKSGCTRGQTWNSTVGQCVTKPTTIPKP